MARRVILIEDEPHIVEAMCFVLRRDGWEVSTHSDGATAADTIRDLRPDAVILDVMLPNRSGFDILRDLRAGDIAQDVPVLMLTAKGQTKDREKAERAGASQFMTKPFSNQDVLDTLRMIVDR